MISLDTLTVVDTVKVFNVSNSNPFNYVTFINIVLIIVNTIVGVYINFIAFRKRKKDDRFYKAKFDLYKLLVLNNFSKFIEHCNEVELLLLNVTNSKVTSEKRILLVEENFILIEGKQTKFYTDILPYVSCYSKDMSKELYQAVECFYNETTDLLSKMAAPVHTNENKILQKFSFQKENYFESVYLLINKYQPQL